MNSKSENKSLSAQLGLFTTLSIVIGAMIGSGIFKKPAFMAAHLNSPELMLAVWVIAGVLTLFGALTNAEIAGMITATGGQYVFFQKMYGNLPAFLYGWAVFSVMQTGSIASITYVFAEYSGHFFVLPRLPAGIEQSFSLYIPYLGTFLPLENIGVKLLTIFTICFLSGINYFGVKFGGKVSAYFTTLKLAVILALVVFSFTYSGGSFENLSSAPSFQFDFTTAFAGIIAAMSAAFWAFDGWNNITFIAGEVKNPQKNIPAALFIGSVIVIAVYLIVNTAFLYVMPVGEMSGSPLVAADVAMKSMGGIGAGFVSAAVMISTFGSSNGSIMASARVYFAMAERKMFFPSAAKVHPKYKTPANALLLQAIWASVLVLSGTFDILTDMLIFVSWIFYAFGALGVFVLRKKMPDTPRPYKVWGYPYVPIIFIIFAFTFVFFTMYNDIVSYTNGESRIINSLFGLLLVFAGVPLYMYFKRKEKNAESSL